ncbi:MAG: ABC transporter substrate-binding protein, partial [Dehalococcoidia bacterium]
MVSAGAASAAILAACGSDDGGTSGGPQTQTEAGSTAKAEGTFSKQEGTPVAGGTYRFPLAGSANFNPFVNYTEGASLGGIFVYDRPLSSREDTRRYVLEAMESIELKDPLTLVMKLRPGLVYQNLAPVNGRAVEASDIVAGQEYNKVTPNAFDKTFVNSYLDRAEAVDKSTVIYHLKRPAAYLFGGQLLGSGTGQPIVPKETLDNLNEGLQVGSGMFMVDQQRRDVVYTYKQNPTYWGRKEKTAVPYVNGVEVTFVADKSAQEAGFYGDKFDFFAPSPAQMRTAKTRLPNAQFFSQAGFNTCNFSVNMWKERALPWQDIRVRQALWLLTDTNELLTRGYEGAGELPTGLLPVSLKPYQVDKKDSDAYRKVDVAEAKKLLAAANWNESKEWGIMGRGYG